MDVSMIEKHNSLKRGNKISVRPYTEKKTSNMGLEKYDMVVFEGVVHEEPLACLEEHGVRRYLTGLNEFAPEVKMLPDDEREAKVKQIRETVSQFLFLIETPKTDKLDIILRAIIAEIFCPQVAL